MSNRLETMLSKAGRELADYQVARFYKIPEAFTQTPCDFMGYTKTGRVLMIEAKMVNRPSLPLSDTSNGISPHQWNDLMDCHKAGGLALIVWAVGSEVAALEMSIAAILMGGRKSIPWKLIPQHRKRSMNGASAHLEILADYLPIPNSK